MESIKEKVTVFDYVMAGMAVITLLVVAFGPMSVLNVLMVEVFKAVLIWLLVIYVGVKIFFSSIVSSKVWLIVSVFILLLGGIICSKNVVADFMNGTKTVQLSNVRAVETHNEHFDTYHLNGCDENGKFYEIKMSYDDYKKLRYTNKCNVEFYENTKRLVNVEEIM